MSALAPNLNGTNGINGSIEMKSNQRKRRFFVGPMITDDAFKLSEEFLAKYQDKKPKFGFNGLGEFVYYRTYSRIKENGKNETFCDTLQRVVEGCYEVQRRHCQGMHIPWSKTKAQKSAQEMFERMWDFKFLPPGRGLWAMGTEFMWEKGGSALNNCAFVSTIDYQDDPAEPFCFMLDISMLGVGVGFDAKGANKVRISKPYDTEKTYIIPDSREGWVDSLGILIRSYTSHPEFGKIAFDYSTIRPEGSPIKGFGGTASGPGILKRLHEMIRKHLDEVLQRPTPVLNSVDIVDLMNYIGVCVVAGNVRRTSQLSLGNADDADYRSMKDYNLFPKEVVSHRWASNNSVLATVGMDYTEVAKNIAVNGEPGLVWVNNIQNYGRMADGYQEGIDPATGTNPCSEQSLESYELCCLVETFPANHDDYVDYHRTLKFAYLYAKTVTLLPTHCKKTNAVMLRNRRIGLSQSGIMQAFDKFGRSHVMSHFCDKGYKIVRNWDNIYSKWLCCPKSIKVTTVKPSGSVSLLAGATPGIHYTVAPTRSYWRRVRLAKNSNLLPMLLDAGYHVEDSVTDPNTVVVKFGVSQPNIKTVSEVSLFEQVWNAVVYQSKWSDNQVSVTVQFSKDEASQIANVLSCFDDQLKSVSFLPIEDHGYAQAPYESATDEEIMTYNAGLRQLDFANLHIDGIGSKFCDGDTCVLQ